MLWLKKPEAATVETPRFSWRPILETAARSRNIRLSSGWLDRLEAGCEAAVTRDAAIDFVEGEFDRYDEASTERQIAYHAAELVRLTSNRPWGY